MLRIATFVCLLLTADLAFCETWTVEFGKLGPIHIRMTPRTIAAVKGPQRERENTSLRNVRNDGCDYVYLSDMYLQFENGRLEEIVTGSPKYRMSNGLGVGSRFADIERVFGKGSTVLGKRRVYIGLNHYDDLVPQVTVEAPPEIRREFKKSSASIEFRFERGLLKPRSRVTEFSIGGYSAEGCS